MNEEFNKWWDEDDLTTDGNNFVEGTAAYWAWEGWCAAIKAEREACAKLFDDRNTGTGFYEPYEPAEIIRARGEAND